MLTRGSDEAFGVTYLEVYFKLHVFLQCLVKTLLFVVGELEGELGAEHRGHMQQETAESQEEHRDGEKETRQKADRQV